ncbi:hypothetical protein BDD12DRAFT_849545 [Trichophaea hybrida]|nr:hypothetical protein BDD12DRAFT_849545 [Trichophaea hybrida]
MDAGELQKLVQTIDWDTLSSQLSVIDQDKHRSTISNFNRDEPENFWIAKNLDFKRWERDNNLRALLLTAPPGHGITEVCSHFINIAEGKDSPADGPVLYFFCSSAPAARRSTHLTHTLLHQVVRCSSSRKSNSIAVAFLSTLVDGHIQRSTLDFRENDPQKTTVKKVLNAPDSDLIEALAEALKKAGIRKLSIVVDGLGKGVADCFVQHIMDAVPQLKALLTSRLNPLQDTYDGMLCIEYDQERQGLHIHHPLV